jgi:putative ABC transport system ATP-binding protein
MTAVAELTDLWKVYDLGEVKVEALRGVNLRFDQADYVAIMGASGSGKSTLLNVLGCLDRPTYGRYLLGGDDVATVDDDTLSEMRGKRIGFIFQSYNLIQQLTVVENIEVPLIYQGGATRERREGSRLDHRPNQLSGGQQQRVAIARSLVNDPYFILADEATGNLDSRTSEEIMDLLARLNDEGKTIIMVTHEEDIAEHAHRIIRMKDGQVLEDKINESVRRPTRERA